MGPADGVHGNSAEARESRLYEATRSNATTRDVRSSKSSAYSPTRTSRSWAGTTSVYDRARTNDWPRPPRRRCAREYDLIFVRVDAPRDLARIARAAEHLKSERRGLGLPSQGARRITDRRVKCARPASPPGSWTTKSAPTPIPTPPRASSSRSRCAKLHPGD